ncbi:MAG: hypothetical protein ACE5DQ_01770 [Candidatus Paceibacterota bacterium]
MSINKNSNRNKSIQRKKLEAKQQSTTHIAKLAHHISQHIEKESKTQKKKLGISYVFSRIAEAAANTYIDYKYPSMYRLLYPDYPGPEQTKSRYTVGYIKRYIRRLENQKLIKIDEKGGMQTITITKNGKKKILKMAIDQVKVKKPKKWDGSWWLVSYDLPGSYSKYRHLIRSNFLKWGFYPLHKSVYLHAFPCSDQVEFLREYLGLGKFIRIFKVKKIEHDYIYRKFFKLF